MTASTAMGWPRLDLGPYVRGEITEPEPAVLDRADGVHLWTPRKVGWVSGEPEGGKTWFVLLPVADALADGYGAVYVDFEGDASTIVERLLALGVPAEAIADRLAYHRPETPMSPAVVAQVLASAEELQPLVSVLDGVNAAMGTSGLDSNKAADFYRWREALVQPLRRLTPGPVLAVDHVVKNADARAQYASGTAQKQAAVDTHIGVEVTDQFGIGRTGRMRLVLHKDKAGRLRQHQAPDRTIGELVLVSGPDRSVRFMIEPPGERDPKPFRPTALMQRVSRHVEGAAEPLSKRRIRSEVPGKERGLLAAVERLHEEGYLIATTKAGYAVYASAKPYRQDDDEEPDEAGGAPGARWCPRGAGHQSGGVVPLVPGLPLTGDRGHHHPTPVPPGPTVVVVPPVLDDPDEDAEDRGYLESMQEHFPADLDEAAR